MRLLQLYGPLVYSWSRQGGLQQADAADVVQEVFRESYAALPNFQHDQSGDSLRGWLCVTAKTSFTTTIRRRGRSPQPLQSEDAFQPPDPRSGDPSNTPAAEHIQLVRRALALVRTEFAETTWQAFWLTAVEGQPAADAANKLGTTAGRPPGQIQGPSPLACRTERFEVVANNYVRQPRISRITRMTRIQR